VCARGKFRSSFNGLLTTVLIGLKAVETAAAKTVTWLKPGVNEMTLYLVKINLIPAMTSTAARQNEIVRTGNLQF